MNTTVSQPTRSRPFSIDGLGAILLTATLLAAVAVSTPGFTSTEQGPTSVAEAFAGFRG